MHETPKIQSYKDSVVSISINGLEVETGSTRSDGSVLVFLQPHCRFSSTPLSLDSTVITLSRDKVLAFAGKR